MSEPKNILTDITVEENSMVDRAANRRTFLVRKHEDGYINPIFRSDQELAAQDNADKEQGQATGEKNMKKNDLAVAAQVAESVAAPPIELVTKPAVEKTEPAVVTPAVEKIEPVVTPAAEKTEPVVTPEKVESGTEPEKAAPVAPVVEKIETVAVPSETKKADAPAAQERVSIQPALKGALEAGLKSVAELADRALNNLAAASADVSGMSWTPWEVRSMIQQIDDLADRMLDEEGEGFGGSAWVADAILAGGAAAGAIDVSKSGAAMASARLSKFTSCHGDMGSAFKAMKKAHDSMGDMLKELAGGKKVEKAEDAPVVSDAVILSASVTKSENNMSELIDLRKAVDDLRRLVGQQAAALEKARVPQASNVIPVEKRDRGSGTMNEDVVWDSDMGARNKVKPGKF
jgi:hypothetical protein